jgi:hypothetical protein
MTALKHLPDTARVWVFTTAAPLTAEQSTAAESVLGAFVADWRSHGAPVNGGHELIENRFVVIAADETVNDVSGCSIDGMFRTVTDALGGAGVGLADTADIAFRDETGVRVLDRPAFAKLVREGVIGDDTPVFDQTVKTLGDLRAGKWERPFSAAWHGAHFKRAAAAR